jgi:hypothetical protein
MPYGQGFWGPRLAHAPAAVAGQGFWGLRLAHAPAAVAGAPMVPISWQEMQCPKTSAVENRKVAKVVTK